MNDMTHNPDGMAIYRRLLSHVLPYWKIFLFAILGMVIFSLSEGAYAKLIEPLVDGSFVNKDPDTIKWIPILMILVFMVRSFGSFLSEYGMAWVARSVIRDLRRKVFNQLLCLPANYYDTTSSGTLLSKMVYDVEQLAEAALRRVPAHADHRDAFRVVALLRGGQDVVDHAPVGGVGGLAVWGSASSNPG